MQYFRNYELANMFNVSQAAVGKWVNAAKASKLELELVEAEGRSYIANTSRNLALVESMVKERKKYFNTRSLKTITPSPQFYKLYNDEQILDIISGIDIRREISHQYSYVDEGAEYWERYAQKLKQENTPNLLMSTDKLMRANQAYFDMLANGYDKINIVDIGVGDAYPARGLLTYLLEKGVLGRYIGLDISPEMLTVAGRNVSEWFGGKVKFEGYVRDICHDRFVDLLASDSSENVLNVVLFFGGTLCNFPAPVDVLKVVSSSMGKKDLFLYSGLLDSPSTRLYFDFNVEPGLSILPTHKMVLDLLGIEESFYEAERFFDDTLRARFMRVRLKIALTITFALSTGERQVRLAKGDTLLLWRHWHFSTLETLTLLGQGGFDLLQASQTPDHSYIFVTSEVKTAQSGY